MHARKVRGLGACTALSVVLLAAPRLGAQELGATLLSYRAPDGCPEVSDFERSVQRRSTRVRFVDQGPHDRRLSIEVRKDGEATRGELRLVESDGRVSQRSVRFTSCAEAVEGLALIALVSLDPQALTEPAKPQEASPLPPETRNQAPATPKTPPPKSAAGPAALRAKPRFALGAAFQVAPSALPETAFGGALFADFALAEGPPFAPLFRLAISHVERRGLSASGGAEANFTLTLATLSACPWQLGSEFLRVRPCAFGSAGALYAWGSQTTNLQRRTRPYAVLGGSALFLVGVSQAVDLFADLAAGATLVRDSFGFEQDQPWKTPALYLSSGIGVRFALR